MDALYTILVVEDEANLRALITRYLESLGYSVWGAENGQEALDMILESPPDLVLTDMYLPVRTGKDLVEVINKQYPALPIVAMTGMPKVSDAVDLLKAGVRDYLAKPLQLDRLATVLHAALTNQPATAPTVRAELASIRQGDTIAGYRLGEPIGRGTMGLVFEATREDDPSAPKVAIKVLQPGPNQGHDEVLEERFMREAKIACQIDHPAIVEIHDYGIEPTRHLPFMVMEFVVGESLEHIIDSERSLTYHQKAHILYQIAGALSVIHSHDLCHRDIKPSNIIVDSNLRARLTDFGLVRVPNSELTGTYRVVGTPAYLAPESYRNAVVDKRVDLFALGVTAYELFFGVRPFDSVIFATLVLQIEKEAPIEPRKQARDFPLVLQDILAKLLKKKPDERYQDASEVMADLGTYLDGNTTQLRKVTAYLKNLRRNDWR